MHAKKIDLSKPAPAQEADLTAILKKRLNEIHFVEMNSFDSDDENNWF